MKALLPALLAAALVMGCDGAPSQAHAQTAPATVPAQAAEQPSTPESVARAFLAAGNARDLRALRELLTRNSQVLLDPIAADLQEMMTEVVQPGAVSVAAEHPAHRWVRIEVTTEGPTDVLFLRQEQGRWRVDFADELLELARFITHPGRMQDAPADRVSGLALAEADLPEGWRIAEEFTGRQPAKHPAVAQRLEQSFWHDQGRAIVHYQLFSDPLEAAYAFWKTTQRQPAGPEPEAMNLGEEAAYLPAHRTPEGMSLSSRFALRSGPLLLTIANATGEQCAAVAATVLEKLARSGVQP